MLDKTVEYLKELITQNEQLAGTAKLAEKSANALSLLQNQITVLEKENAFLRAQIIQFGIDAAASSSQPSNINRQVLSSPLAQSLLNTVAQTQAPIATPQPLPTPIPPQNPVAANTQAAAQQLLLSLAQSLTNSPLLTSLAQNPPGLVSSIKTSPSRLTSSPTLTVTTAPAQLVTSSQVSSPMAAPQHLVSSPSQVAPIINSLIQTLASIANTNPSPPLPPPATTTRAQTPPQTQPSYGGLSAAAAASVLNTLIMAQNVLTGGNNSGGGVVPGQGIGSDSASVLSSVGLEAVSRGEQQQT